MSSDNFEQRKRAEIEALKILKNSFFILGAVQLAFLIVMTVLVVQMVFSSLQTSSSGFEWVSIALSGVVYSMYGIFLFTFLLQLNTGIEYLESFVPHLRIVKYGILTLAIGTIVLIPSNTVISASFEYSILSPIWLISIVSALIMFIGQVMIFIGVWRMGEHYGVSDLKMGAVLAVLLSVIGTFVVYSAFSGAIKKVERRIPPPPIPPWI